MVDQGSAMTSVSSEADKCQTRYLHVAVTNTGAAGFTLTMDVKVSMKEVEYDSSAFWAMSALSGLLAVVAATLL